MAAIRHSGATSAFTWDFDLIRPGQNGFGVERLQEHRFRTIASAATEETSTGWCTQADPSGGSFDLEDLDAGNACWLRLRIDVKRLPKDQVTMHLAAATRAKGRALTAKERRDQKQELADALLPKLPPKTVLVDVLVWFDDKRGLLFSTAKAARDTFGKLWFQTFGCPAQWLEPGLLAREKLDDADGRALEKLSPVRWPVAVGGA